MLAMVATRTPPAFLTVCTFVSTSLSIISRDGQSLACLALACLPLIFLRFVFADQPDKLNSVLGRGQFGCVYRMVDSRDQQEFAVKELTTLPHEDGSPDNNAMDELLIEVCKMGTVCSDFVIKYHSSSIFRGHFYIVTELVVSYRATK